MNHRPYICKYTVYEDSTTPKQSSMLLDATDWYRSPSMITGILAGVLLEKMVMITLPNPLHFCIFFSWTTNYCFGLLVVLSMFLTNSPRIKAGSFWERLFITAVAVLLIFSVVTLFLPNKQEYTETERMFGIAVISSVYFVTYICSLLALATRSNYYWSFRRFFSLLRNVVVFVGACSLGVNACLFIASLIGLIPVVYDETVFLALELCRSLVLIVAAWIQEKIILFQEVKTTKSAKETEEGDDTLEYSFYA
jgi:hypothetical protein